MGNIRFDWRWVILIGTVAVLANARRLPPAVLALALGAAGIYLLYAGWQQWGGGSFSRTHVKYWRGQRYEVRPDRRRTAIPSLRAIGPALLPLILGLTLVLSAVAVVLR
jgi:hypothetical protein